MFFCPCSHISPPYLCKTTPNHPHSYAQDAQTISICHALPHQPCTHGISRRLHKSSLHFLSFKDTPHTISTSSPQSPDYSDSQPSFKDEAKIVSRGELSGSGMISLLTDKYNCKIRNLRRCCLAPIRKNSFFGRLRSHFFKFIEERYVSDSSGEDSREIK